MRIAASLLALTTGCSFAFTSGPPANHRQLPYFNCSESRIAPGLDVAWTVLQTLNLALAASQSDQEWNDNFANGEAPFSRQTAVGLYVGMAALGAAGAYYGFSKTGECRAAKQELMIRQTQGGGQQMNPQGPGTWPPPAPGPMPPPAPAPAPAPDPAPPPPVPESAPPSL